MESTVRTKLTVLWDDDCLILDYLADLIDRDPIHCLQFAVDHYGDTSLCLVRRSILDDKFIVILWKSELNYNMPGNNMILFAHPALTTIISYFCQIMTTIPYSEVKKRRIIQEILSTLQDKKEQIEYRETQTNHMG
jgi:hypothetical protein